MGRKSDLAHHFATTHDVDATAGGERIEAATAERVDGFGRAIVQHAVQARRRPTTELHLHGYLHAGHFEVEDESEAVGRDITVGFHVDRFRARGHPKHNARQIARGEAGFALAAEGLFVALGRNGQIAELDVPHAEWVAAAHFENEVAEFEIHFAVMFGQEHLGVDGGCCARFSAEFNHELVGEGTSLCAGAQAQHGGEHEE